MKPQRELAANYRWIDHHLSILRPQVGLAAALPSGERLQALSHIVIEAHNLSAAFLRSYYLASATGADLAAGGSVTTAVRLKTTFEALTFAVHAEKHWLRHRTGPWSSRQEPTWHDANVLIRLLNTAGCSTTPGVAAAFGIGSDALPHLTTARNFFAHRGEETGTKLRNLGRSYRVGYPRDPVELLATRAPRRSQTIIEDWLDDLATMFSLMPV